MADISNFVSVETQGTEDFGSVDNSAQVTFATSPVYQDQSRVLQFTGNASRGAVGYSREGHNHTAPTSNHIIQSFYVRFTNVDPGTEYIFAGWINNDGSRNIIGDPNNIEINLILEADGDVRVVNDQDSSTVETITDPFTADTWHRVDLRVLPGASSSGEFQIWVDGTSSGNNTGITTGTPYSQFGGFSFAGPLADGGNMFVANAHSIINSTADTDLLDDDFEVIGPYQGDPVASATPDLGDDLDTGTWATSQEIPFDDESDAAASTYSTDKSGVVFTNTDGGGVRIGPTGDSRIDGTSNIIAWKHLMRADRGSGGGSTHDMLTGNSGMSAEGDGQVTSLTVGTSPANFSMVTDDPTEMPTSTESFALGMAFTGARDFQLREMAGFVLHVPAAAVTELPPLTMAPRIPI